MFQIRAAQAADYERVREFYYALTDAMENAEFKPGWEKDVYPTQAFLQTSIENGELYIGEEDGKTAACMVVNHAYNEGYNSVHWAVDVPDDELLVIHALGVHPAFSGKGYAKQLTAYVIRLVRESGIKAIRLDVLGGNLPAEKAYTAMGFQYRDTLRMFYEDTGWTDFKVYEYIV